MVPGASARAPVASYAPAPELVHGDSTTHATCGDACRVAGAPSDAGRWLAVKTADGALKATRTPASTTGSGALFRSSTWKGVEAGLGRE